jgi:hypothetical protein
MGSAYQLGYFHCCDDPIFKRKINTVFKDFTMGYRSLWYCSSILLTPVVTVFIVSLTVFLWIYYMIVSWKSLRGAVGSSGRDIISMSFGVVLATLAIVAPDANYFWLWFFTGVCLSFPLSLLVCCHAV